MKIFSLAAFLSFLFISGSFVKAQQPQLVVDPLGHSAMIKDVLFTPDGKTLVSVSDDKTIRLWNTATGTLRKTIRGSTGEGPIGKINAAALSPDGQLLAVGGYFPNDEIRIFHLNTGKQIASLKGHSNVVTDLDFDGSGNLLASASGDETVNIWKVPATGNNGQFLGQPALVTTLKGHTGPVYGVAMATNGRKVVSASFDGTLRLQYLGADGAPVGDGKVIQKHQDRVYCVDISPDGQFIASGGMDGKVYLWDSDGNFYNIIRELGEEIYTLSFSYGMNKLVAMTTSGTVYEVPFGLTLGKFTRHDNTVRASAFAPVRLKDGSEVVATAGGTNNEIFIWNAENGEVLQQIAGHGRPVWSVSFGEGLTAAFGQSPEQAAAARKVQQKVFDFNNLKLVLQPLGTENFKKARHNYGGLLLKQRDDLTLQIGNGAKIRNDATTGRTIRAFTFTNTGEVVVGSAGSLRKYNQSGELLLDFKGHTGEVWDVAVSADGRMLVSASFDQTVKLWNLETGELLATLFVTAGNEWICWSPAGYYAASAGGEQYVGWHIDKGPEQAAEYYPVKNFRSRYLKPELLKQIIAAGSFEQAVADYARVTGQKIDPAKNIAEVMPPVVEWLNPSVYITETAGNSVKVKAKVTSDVPITEVKLLVDGRPLGQKRGFKVENKDTPTKKWVEFDVPLVNRESAIQIYAANENASALSEERVVRVARQPVFADAGSSEAEELEFDALDYLVKPNLYILSIGVSDFANPDYNLNYADDDARAVPEMYRKRHKKIFSNVYTRELIDAGATRQNILEGFKWLEENTTYRDVVVIFVASHGFNIEKNFYILPFDGNTDNLEQTAVSWNSFASVLGNLTSKVLMFMDACHSGQLGSNVASVNNTEALRSMSSEENGVVIMSASTGDESSLEHPDWGHGAFTYALLEGIEQGYADLRPDKIIYLRELDFYVADRVRDMTAGRQNPTTQKPSTISSFAVASLE